MSRIARATAIVSARRIHATWNGSFVWSRMMTEVLSSASSMARRQVPLTFIFGESAQRVDAMARLLDALAARKVEQLDEERALDDGRAGTLDQRQRRERGAARREQV